MHEALPHDALSELPHELLCSIFVHVEAIDCCHLACVCHRLVSPARDDDVWEELHRRQWHLCLHTDGGEASWYNEYMRRHRVDVRAVALVEQLAREKRNQLTLRDLWAKLVALGDAASERVAKLTCDASASADVRTEAEAVLLSLNQWAVQREWDELLLRAAVRGNAPSTAFAEHPLIGRRITVSGIVSRPELNGQRAAVVAYDAASDRYQVHMTATGEFILLRAARCVPSESGDHGRGTAVATPAALAPAPAPAPAAAAAAAATLDDEAGPTVEDGALLLMRLYQSVEQLRDAHTGSQDRSDVATRKHIASLTANVARRLAMREEAAAAKTSESGGGDSSPACAGTDDVKRVRALR